MLNKKDYKMECSVCYETYNKKRKCVTCCFCSYSSCLCCIKKYLLDSFHLPHCMNCRKEWIHSFVIGEIGYHFMNTEYRKKREQLLIERERSFIPEMLPIAEHEKKIKNITQHLTNSQNELIHMYQNYSYETREKWKQEKKEIKQTIRALVLDRNKLLDTHHTPKKLFIMKCILPECKGFLSTRYKCGLCSIQVCKECHKTMESEHKCNEDDVLTVTELKKSTKPCPSCQCPIYKSEGCDQMWCIQCHTTFSWKSGMIEKGIIHNPHYFEFIKDKGDLPRNPYDIICGGLPDYRTVYELVVQDMYSQDQVTYIQLLYETLIHLREITLQELPTLQEQVDNKDLLLKFILDEITEHHFKSLLYVREQKRNRGIEERNMTEAYVLVGEEAFRKMVKRNITFFEFLHEMEEIKSYTKKELLALDDRYQHKGFVSHDFI